MVSKYMPKRHFFSSQRIQLTGKEIIKECLEDRERALAAFKYFKDRVDSDPADDKSKSEMVKCLELSMGANDKKVKLLDLMVKLAMHRDKINPKSSKGDLVGELTFEDFTNVTKETK